MMLDTAAENRKLEILEEDYPEERVVTLQPLAMRVFNSHGIYSPSKLRPKKEVSYDEFLTRYANNSVEVLVCLEEESLEDTMVDRSQVMDAYGFGYEGWHIIDPTSSLSTPSEGDNNEIKPH